MRFTFSILLVLCFLQLNSQVYVRDSINRVDANGKRQGYWVITASMKKQGPPWTPDQTVEEGRYIDSRKDGKWIEYYPNGLVKYERNYVNGRISGFSKSYYQSPHILKEESTYYLNRYIGQYKAYYPGGQLQYHFNYDSTGKKTGMQYYWYENGNLRMEAQYTFGKQHGWTKEYYNNGKLKRETYYNTGTIDAAKTKEYPDNDPDKKPAKPVSQPKEGCEGYWTLHNANNQVSKKGNFHNCQLVDGEERIYDKNGLLLQIKLYKDGKYVGDAPLLLEEKK